MSQTYRTLQRFTLNYYPRHLTSNPKCCYTYQRTVPGVWVCSLVMFIFLSSKDQNSLCSNAARTCISKAQYTLVDHIARLAYRPPIDGLQTQLLGRLQTPFHVCLVSTLQVQYPIQFLSADTKWNEVKDYCRYLVVYVRCDRDRSKVKNKNLCFFAIGVRA